MGVYQGMITHPGLSNSLLNILTDVAAERERQDVKWGEQNHDDAHWAPILGEEFGEAMTEVNNILWYKGEIKKEVLIQHLREELVQVAAVAVAWIECFDRRESNASGQGRQS